MAGSTMKYWRAYMFLLFVLLNRLPSYSHNDTLQLKQLADSLFSGGQYYAAGIYYQKLEFFARGEVQKSHAKLMTGECYKLNGSYNDGVEYLNSISLEDAPDSLIGKIKYQCALMCYLNNDLPRAELFLQQLAYLVKDSAYRINSNLLYTLVLNEQYRWPEAKEKLIALNNSMIIDARLKEDNNQLIDSMYNPAKMPKLKSREKAGRKSAFFPGLGQCYTGNYGEGIGSFLAISICAGAMVVGIVYQYYFTSIFVGNLLIGKFYLGGVSRAEFLADKYNYKKSKDYNVFLKSQLNQHFVK